MSCNICAENFNKSTRFSIGCPYCNFEACRNCWSTWFMNESEPTCMAPGCGKDWTRAHLRDRFTQKFMTKDLKNHREQVLFDKERALLPATQPFVEAINLRKHVDREIRDLQREISKLHTEIANKETEYTRQRRALLGETNDAAVQRQERSAFIRACPVQDCRGFLSSQWKCGVCENWTCPECNVIKGKEKNVEHTCNADDVATAKLIANDTRSCPTCGMGIYKIDGCDQMWCTQCHTAFSFRTGRIENNIHNPHYYEWMRRTGQELARAPGDNPRAVENYGCRGQLDHNYIRQLTRDMERIERNIKDILLIRYEEIMRSQCEQENENTIQSKTRQVSREIYAASQYNINMISTFGRELIHLIYYIRDNRRIDRVDENRQLRIDYLMKNISEEDFKIQLQRREKKLLKTNEVHDVLVLFTQSSSDILMRFGREVATKGYINQSILNEINQLHEYVNDCFADIARTYGCALPNLRNYGMYIQFPLESIDPYEALTTNINIDSAIDDLIVDLSKEMPIAKQYTETLFEENLEKYSNIINVKFKVYIGLKAILTTPRIPSGNEIPSGNGTI